jgi:streptogramin lyase
MAPFLADGPFSCPVRKSTTGGTVTEYTVGSFTAPHDISAAPGSDGKLWFTEYIANKIAKIANDGTGYTTYSIPTASSNPEDIVAGPDGNLWFAENGGNKIAKVTTSGTFTEYTLAPQEDVERQRIAASTLRGFSATVRRQSSKVVDQNGQLRG